MESFEDEYADRWWYPLYHELNSFDIDDAWGRQAKTQGPHPLNVLESRRIQVQSEAEHFVGWAGDEYEHFAGTGRGPELRYFWRHLTPGNDPAGHHDDDEPGWLVGNINGPADGVVFGWCDESISKDRPRYLVEHRWRNPYTLKMERGNYKEFGSQWDAWFYATLLMLTLRRVRDTIIHATYKTWDMSQEWEG